MTSTRLRDLLAKITISLAAVVIVLTSASVLHASPIVVGAPNSANCIPFTCAEEYAVTTYQQVYASAAFRGVTPFDQINFFLDPLFTGGLDSGTYDIAFSYTSEAVDGLTASSLSANIGADEAVFGHYTLPGGNAPSRLTFNGNTFSYGPTLGNLLMTITISGAADPSPVAFYEADATGAVTSRAFFGSFDDADSDGLVTGFNDVASVPEPATLTLAVLGVSAIVTRCRRRRSAI